MRRLDCPGEPFQRGKFGLTLSHTNHIIRNQLVRSIKLLHLEENLQMCSQILQNSWHNKFLALNCFFHFITNLLFSIEAH